MLTKKELWEVQEKGAVVMADGYESFLGVMDVLINEALHSRWKNYPEVKPKKDGYYLIKATDSFNGDVHHYIDKFNLGEFEQLNNQLTQVEDTQVIETTPVTQHSDDSFSEEEKQAIREAELAGN